ncbi:early nodulin-75-like [Haliotis rubra]|uniref:early nodulin-75-like n=1 Tax=Haliotis rubra TaxID=36100 RepID=UPI001EE57C5F|nr:early nodulin-75-like [Haliotis rubra]
MVYMSYPNRPPADCQSRTEYPTPDAQLPSIEDNGHHRAGRSQMQFATQQMEPIPPVPQPWSENPHSEYLPVPSLCYCGNLPPHHHPNGSVYVPYPNSPPAGSQSRSYHPNHGGQHPASMEDKGHQGTGKVEMHHALQQMQPNPPEPHPWNGYPHCGHLPLPLCYCCNIPPHHHPGGMALMSYPNRPPEDSQPKTEHPNLDGQPSASVEDTEHQRVVTSQMNHTTQPMQPHNGYQQLPPFCYCGKLPPHHPDGIMHVPYSHMPPTDGQP